MYSQVPGVYKCVKRFAHRRLSERAVCGRPLGLLEWVNLAGWHLTCSPVISMKLSVVMPVYNERATLRTVVERVLAVPLQIELLCVDDGSKDGSREILADLQARYPQM